MDPTGIDHLNLRIPADRVDEFVSLYRDSLGFEFEHLNAYRSGDRGFFYVRLADDTVIHVSPTDSFSPPDGDGFNHVAIFVAEPRAVVRERLEDAGVEIVEEATRLGADGRRPSISFEDPFGYPIEITSPE